MINLKRRTNDSLILEDTESEKVPRGPGSYQGNQEIACLGVRCGLSWPLAVNPGGYYCLVAQEARKLITGERPLLVIREFKALTITALFE